MTGSTQIRFCFSCQLFIYQMLHVFIVFDAHEKGIKKSLGTADIVLAVHNPYTLAIPPVESGLPMRF